MVLVMSDTLTDKQAEFNDAMERYDRLRWIRWTSKLASFFNVALQLTLAALVLPISIGWAWQLAVLVVAYFVADLVNGWVHLYMDCSDTYRSMTGPFFAAFHLHHRTPRYRRRSLPLVYFEESGAKLWLVVVQLLMVAGLCLHLVSGVFAYFVLYFAVLSSVAEVSHYLCHTPQTRVGQLLARMGLLLSARYHARHHREDNVQYAFLNGMSDPLLNLLAQRFYTGYKTTTDTHYARYAGPETQNRG